MTPEITLSLHDELPASDDFIDLRASVSCRGFSGRTTFTIARRDVRRFLAEASDLQAGAGDSALLLGGWEAAEERLRLRIARAGLSGRFAVRVRVSAMGAIDGDWDRVETEFVAAPGALAVFMDDLARLVARRETRSASLTGDTAESV